MSKNKWLEHYLQSWIVVRQLWWVPILTSTIAPLWQTEKVPMAFCTLQDFSWPQETGMMRPSLPFSQTNLLLPPPNPSWSPCPPGSWGTIWTRSVRSVWRSSSRMTSWPACPASTSSTLRVSRRGLTRQPTAPCAGQSYCIKQAQDVTMSIRPSVCELKLLRLVYSEQWTYFRKQFPTDDPEWEEMQRQKARVKRREEDLEVLHNSMFGWYIVKIFVLFWLIITHLI